MGSEREGAREYLLLHASWLRVFPRGSERGFVDRLKMAVLASRGVLQVAHPIEVVALFMLGLEASQ